MSCRLNRYALIANLRAIKNALGFEDSNREDDYSSEAWNSSWDWEDSNIEKSQEMGKLKFEDQSWLQECISSLSPTVDVLALAYKQNAVFLASKWDVGEESEMKLKFFSSFEGPLPSTEKNEDVSSLLCLPLASQKRPVKSIKSIRPVPEDCFSNPSEKGGFPKSIRPVWSLQGGPDWTCIIVGYSSGYVRIYTEKGELLLSQLLHEEPVNQLRFKTHIPHHYSSHKEQPEELVIVYCTVVVTIDGFGLFQTLRACRNQLARATASRQEAVHPPPLAYKKWGFQEHDKLIDCDAAGLLSTTAFDHLVTESIRKGFYGAAKTSIPSNSLLITTGSNPYVGFYYATEGSSQTLLSDVVHAVAHKLINFLTNSNAGGLLGFISRSEQDDQKNKPKIEPATVLPLRFGLYDKRRQGFTLTLSPNKSLAAVADTFGRVILFNALQGVAVRMWKGYRDAQCGWIEVEDNLKKGHHSLPTHDKIKRAFFLVIYAPRRGILEVWCAQQGPRAAAFNVGKSGRLFYPGYSMAGTNFSFSGSSKPSLSSCYFLDTDGILKKVIVPFHSILSERNSKRARDLHLLKELKTSLKNKSKDKIADIVKIIEDMRTSSIRIQALDSVANSRYATVDLVEEVAVSILTNLQKQDPEQIDHEMKLLRQSCVRVVQLVKFYCSINEINTKAIPESTAESIIDIQMYSSKLCISEAEIGHVLSLVTLHQTVVPVLKKHVRFLDDSATDMAFSDFMSCFTVTDSHLIKAGEDIMTKNLPIILDNSIAEKQVEALGGFIFHTSIHDGACLNTFQTSLKESGIPPDHLLRLLLQHWVSDIGFCSDADKWLNLQQVLRHISALYDPKLVSCDVYKISPWWKSVREIFLQSTSNLAAYVGCVVARSVSIIMVSSASIQPKDHCDLTEKPPADEKAESEDSDWESVSLDLEHWNLLLRKLEDMLLLSMLLKSQPFGKITVKDVNLSLDSVVKGGPGTITDLLSAWAVSVGFNPKLLLHFVTDGENNEFFPSKQESECPEQRAFVIAKGLMQELKKRFPCSTDADALLANCSWEHMMQWSKTKDIIEHLTSSLSCLELVGSSVVKNGFSLMMWKSCAQKRFEALALLMEKVGKTPKERLCRKELEMSDNCLEGFLDFCCQLLNIILETNMTMESKEVPNILCEYLWQDRDEQGPTPLIEMALGQKTSNNYLVYQHLSLSTVLLFAVTFQIKSVKPLSLFSEITRKAFFRELYQKLSPEDEKEDSTLQTLRMQFLLKVVAVIAQSFPERVPDATGMQKSLGPDNPLTSESSPQLTNCSSLCSMPGYRLASKWFNRVVEISSGWEVNTDELRRHYVCELYSGGQDSLAEEMMPTVHDKEMLGSQLILIAGQRICNVVFNGINTAEKLTCFSPDVARWLKTLGDIKLRYNGSPLSSTACLLDHILAFLQDGQKRERVYAQSLRNAISELSALS